MEMELLPTEHEGFHKHGPLRILIGGQSTKMRAKKGKILVCSTRVIELRSHNFIHLGVS